MARKAKNRQSGTREPNGRLSRQVDQVAARLRERFKDMDQEQRDTIQPGIEARQRVHGLPLEQAASPMASTFVGRLYLQGELTLRQFEASQLYAEDCRNNARAVQAPREPGAVDLNATKGMDNYENVAKTLRSVARYKAASNAIQDAQNQLRGNGALFAALYEIVLRDREVYHLVPDVRAGLNALVRHYGLMTERKAA